MQVIDNLCSLEVLFNKSVDLNLGFKSESTVRVTAASEWSGLPSVVVSDFIIL